jgi:hypothetical protein
MPAQAGADVTAGQSIDVLRGSQSNYRQAVMALNPVSYWRFSETSGATVKDISGHANNGTYAPSTAGVAYAQPGALQSDPDTCATLATGTYVNVSNNAAIQLNTFSFAMWVKADPNNNPNSFTRLATSIDIVGWRINRHNLDATIYFQISTSTNGDQELLGTTPVFDDAWHFIVVGVNGSTAYLSIDGSAWQTKTFSLGNGIVNTTQPMTILNAYRGA